MTGDLARDFWPFAAVTAVAVIVALALYGSGSFQRFYGSIPPVLLTLIAVAVGAGLMVFLSGRGWLPPEPDRGPQLLRHLVIGAFVAVPAVIFDLFVHFPEDMNVAWPESVPFYTGVALVAEVGFHLVPLAALILVTGWTFGPPGENASRTLVAVLIVAAAEALFQAVDALSGEDRRLVIFVVPQLALVGAVQLLTLRWYGFGAMLMFRYGYYLVWHIVWGYLRLGVVF